MSTGRRRRTRARLRQRGPAARRPTGRRSCTRTTSRCCGNGSIATPSPWSRSSTASGIATVTTSRCSTRPAWCATPRARWCASSASPSTSASRRARRRRLRASQELLQIVAAGTGDWLILVDTERRVQFINRGIRCAFARKHHRSAARRNRRARRPAEHSRGAARRCCRPASRWTCSWRAAATTAACSTRASAPCARRAASPARSSTSPRSPTARRRCICARPRRACSSCCTKAWWSSTSTT